MPVESLNGIFFSLLPLEYGDMDTAAAMDTTETAKVKYSHPAIHCASHRARHHVANCGIATIGNRQFQSTPILVSYQASRATNLLGKSYQDMFHL